MLLEVRMVVILGGYANFMGPKRDFFRGASCLSGPMTIHYFGDLMEGLI